MACPAAVAHRAFGRQGRAGCVRGPDFRLNHKAPWARKSRAAELGSNVEPSKAKVTSRSTFHLDQLIEADNQTPAAADFPPL